MKLDEFDKQLAHQHYQAVLLRAVASRCRKGMTTVDDAEALEVIAREILRTNNQTQDLIA